MRYAQTFDEAQDLLQDTLLLILEKIDHYKEQNFDGWTFTLLTNLHRNKLLHNTLRENIVIVEYNHKDSNRIEEQCDIATAIDSLPSIYRETIILMLKGYKYNEIGQRLDISTGTVKSRIARARQMMQQTLRDYNI